jgi:hypothetical protein
MGGRVAPLSTSPSLEDANLGEATIPHLFATHPVVHRSLSLSPHACVSSLEVCLSSHLVVSKGESASHGSQWPPLRPCARS